MEVRGREGGEGREIVTGPPMAKVGPEVNSPFYPPD